MLLHLQKESKRMEWKMKLINRKITKNFWIYIVPKIVLNGEIQREETKRRRKLSIVNILKSEIQSFRSMYSTDHLINISHKRETNKWVADVKQKTLKLKWNYAWQVVAKSDLVKWPIAPLRYGWSETGSRKELAAKEHNTIEKRRGLF